MSVQSPAPHINLLPKDPFFSTSTGKVLHWASTVGRFLVIFTELVVIGSFAARFKLDRELTDLNEKVFQQSSIIKSYGTLEEDTRAVQQKTEALAIQTATTTPLELIELVAKQMPLNTALTVANIEKTALKITGNAMSSVDLSTFVRALQKSPQVKTLSVENVKTAENGTSGFDFSMTIEAHPK